MIVLAALVAGASAFAPSTTFSRNSVAMSMSGDGPKKGAGGMADTRDPEPSEEDDPRFSITEAPTFEEYMKAQAAKNAAEGN